VSDTQPSPSPQPTPSPGRTPADIVVDFLDAWARYDIDAVLDLVTKDLVYTNVSLPTIHGRDRLELVARPIIRPDRVGFKAYLHHVATDGDVVLTDRTDELHFRRFAARFWVYGRFVVRPGSGSTGASWCVTRRSPSGATRSTGWTSRSATCAGSSVC
jgi:limonene-1,2-epoxide hydrolase